MQSSLVPEQHHQLSLLANMVHTKVKSEFIVKKQRETWKASSRERFSPHFSQSEQMHTPILLNYHLPIIFVIASSKRLFSPQTN